MEDPVGHTSTGHPTGREHSHSRNGGPSATLPRDLYLTRRHHVDLLRTASAVCRRGLAGWAPPRTDRRRHAGL